MDANFKPLWTEALRSGRFTQGSAMLAIVDPEPKHCCLGVACEVFMELHPDLMTFKINTTLGGKTFTFNPDNRSEEDLRFDGHSETVVLPSVLADYLEITPEQQDSLVGMNDDEGKNFLEIADWIDENL